MRQDRLRLRDYYIIAIGIRSALECRTDIGSLASVRLYERGAPPIDENVPLADDMTDMPFVFLEEDRKQLGLDLTYLDPPSVGHPVPALKALQGWGQFVPFLASRSPENGYFDVQYAFALLHRAVMDRKKHGGEEAALRFVHRLHENRWSGGAEMTGRLLMYARTSDEEHLDQLSNDEAFITSRISTVRSIVERAKEQASSNTAWAEMLYLAAPSVWEIMQILRRSTLPKAAKWWRYFSEVDADIAPVRLVGEMTAIREVNKGPERPQIYPPNYSVTASYLTSDKGSKTTAERRANLEYLYKARTTIPRFWYEKALTCLDLTEEEMPEVLNEIDAYRILSLAELEGWSFTLNRRFEGAHTSEISADTNDNDRTSNDP